MELLTTSSGQIVIGIVVVLNIISFFVMAHDKRKAIRRHNDRRTPEGFIFFMATIFGSVGVYLGMQVFRHKTKAWYFQIGIPLLIIQNIAMVYVIGELLN